MPFVFSSFDGDDVPIMEDVFVDFVVAAGPKEAPISPFCSLHGKVGPSVPSQIYPYWDSNR